MSSSILESSIPLTHNILESTNYLKLNYGICHLCKNYTNDDFVKELSILCELYSLNNSISADCKDILEAKLHFYQFTSSFCSFIRRYFHVNPQVIDDDIDSAIKHCNKVTDELSTAMFQIGRILTEKDDTEKNSYVYFYLRSLYIIADTLNILVD